MRRGFLEGSQLHTEFGWLCGYLALLGLFYLFHTPFRSHVVVRTDWYARLTRVTQLWSIVVLFFFHRVPVDEHGSRRTSTADSDGDNAELVFFPVFLFMTTFFSLLHKKKRWLRMGVTYGASFLSVILNSLVMAALCTAHYAYTQHLVELVTLSPLWFDEDARKTPWKRFLHWVTNLFYPVPVTTNPLRMTFHLVVTGMIIVYVDYRYKKRCGYDPHAGLLWSDVFEVTKHPANTRGRESGHDVKGDPTADFRYGEQPLQPPGDAYEVSDKIDFSITPSEYTALLEAKYPFNRPAMVSWLTAFAVGAYIQAGLTRLIELVTSETRSAFVHETPKVFSLSLAPRQTGASAVDGKGSAEADHPAVWFDWVADVGDGFNSTYEIARLLAQPRLRFKATAESATDTTAVVPPYALPRGSFVVVGGDLAYPRPTEETYTSRLFEPYRDALSGNPQLRKLFHARQMELIQPDEHDPDLAHIRVLDAETVAATACGADTLRASRGTAEEALHSVPMLFAIPGNHDWFDGLRIFRKYIMDKTWIGGWLMPQQSSFFVLRLPYNWFMLCCDTGNEQDIDVTQRNYFLDVIEKYMDAASCVILACHEPGWLYDAMEQRTEPLQPELNRLVAVLGTRLRLRMAGDIHNYSRHAPVDALSEAATLIVSGGGGAYLAGARDDRMVSQGTVYKRFGAFPRHNTYLTIATRLWGFRVVNWKFDMIVGVCCFFLIFSSLPLPADLDAFRELSDLGAAANLWWSIVVASVTYFFEEARASYLSALFLFACFSSAGADRAVASYWRWLNGFGWSLVVLFACCCMLAFLQCIMLYVASNDMIASTKDQWKSSLEEDVLLVLSYSVEYISSTFGASSCAARLAAALSARFTGSRLEAAMCLILRMMDGVDTFAYLCMRVGSDRAGHFAPAAGRFTIGMYYLHMLTFYWLLVTPIVSFIIGVFLAISVTMFDFMYDGGYSAFQIEDYKHFMRFRIDHTTRELECFVVGKEKVPKVWEQDPRHISGLTDVVDKNQPPHLRQNPSRWRPSTRTNKESAIASVLERFTIHPHTVPSEGATLVVEKTKTDEDVSAQRPAEL